MMLMKREWVPSACETRVQDIASKASELASDDLLAQIEGLAEQNRVIHEE